MGLGKGGALMLLLGIVGLAIVYDQVKSGQSFENIKMVGYGIAGIAILGLIAMVKGIHWHGRRSGWWR